MYSAKPIPIGGWGRDGVWRSSLHCCFLLRCWPTNWRTRWWLKRRGLPVRNITLFLFGGVSNIQHEPPSSLAEFLITTVGPLTSFVIGFVLTLAGGLTTTAAFSASVATPMELVSQFSPTATILLWLGWINILLAVFDLIPGFSIW